jgi:hypothetical protein
MLSPKNNTNTVLSNPSKPHKRRLKRVEFCPMKTR